MRVTLNDEQLAYLESIGVSMVSTSDSSRREATRKRGHRCSKRSRRRVRWWVVLLGLVTAAVCAVAIARSEECATGSQGSQRHIQEYGGLAGAQIGNRCDWGETRGVGVAMAAGNSEAEQVARLGEMVSELEQRLECMEVRQREILEHEETALKAIESIQAGLDNFAEWRSTTGDRLPALANEHEGHAIGGVDMKFQHLDSEIKRMREDALHLRERLIWLTIGIGALGMFSLVSLIQSISGFKRWRGPMGWPGKGLSLKKVREDGTNHRVPSAPDGRSVNAGSDLGCPQEGQAERLALGAGEEKRENMVELRGQLDGLHVTPHFSSAAWGFGLASIKGPVRSENQDCGVCFELSGRQVLVVADGCGGLPHGQRAARLAVAGAAVSIGQAYGLAPDWHRPAEKDVAARAILDGWARLAAEGERLAVGSVCGGLRTTLIVVVANENHFAYAYIGDGGGCVVKLGGRVEHFIVPQKAHDAPSNVLAASLGPAIEGTPVAGLIKREAGDLLIVGSDGVFDRVDAGFPTDVFRGCVQHQGDLQRAAERIVEELASFRDNAGYICDDNLTLGLMGDGKNTTLTGALVR